MGFICVVRNEETDVAKLKKGVWPDAYIYGEDAKGPEKLTNGANVIVTPNSIAVQTKDGKLVDIITTPGGYLYHENAPVNERLEDYATFMQGMVELFMQEAEMEATGLAFIETDRQISSPEELHAWFMQFTQPEPEPEPIPELVSAPAPKQSQDTSRECPAWDTGNQFSFCKNCGKDLRNYTKIKFCPGCGKVL